MLYRLHHRTTHTYSDPVTSCHSELRLAPRDTVRQRVLAHSLNITPEPLESDTRVDYFGNRVRYFSLMEPHEELEIISEGLVEIDPPEPVNEQDTPSCDDVCEALRAAGDGAVYEAIQFIAETPLTAADPGLVRYGLDSIQPDRPILAAARELCQRIHGGFKYVPESTTIDTTAAQAFAARRGVCQDFAHLMIAMLRSAGLAARYVSGYLRSGANFTGAEASHAWVSVFVPGIGWIDLDPTNNVLPSIGHVTLAWGRDYGDVAPVKGVTLGGGAQKVDVEVRVTPVDPRPE